MEAYYTLNDLAEMTGLTTRTLRNYLKLGFLQGTKENGIWQFTGEEFTDFISNPNVKPALTAKRQGIVYDFLADSKKKGARVCLILDDTGDVPLQTLMAKVNSLKAGDAGLRFAMQMQNGTMRLILSAALKDSLEFMQGYLEL